MSTARPSRSLGGVLVFMRRNGVRLAICALVLFGVFVACRFTTDPDFGWHIRSGQAIIDQGIPATDPYTYTMPDFAWVNHEWLSDALTAALYRIGGYLAITILFTALWCVGLVLATRRFRWQALALGFIGLIPYLGPRPVAWTFLGVVSLERLLAAYRRDGRSRWLLAISVLLLAWANLHGGFAIALVVIALHAAYYRDTKLIHALGVMAGVTLINPYGWRVYEEIFRTLLDSSLKHNITEWQPLFTSPSTGLRTVAPAIFLTVSFAVLPFIINRKVRRSLLSLPVLTLAMAFSSMRQFVLYVATSLRYVEDGIDYVVARLDRISRAIFNLVIVLLAGYCAYAYASPRLQNRHYITPLAANLRTHCQGNVFNSYDIGGYLIFNAPEYRVYIDGRMPSWSDGEGRIFDRYSRVLRDPDYRQAEFARFSIACVVIERRGTTASEMVRQLVSEGWKSTDGDGTYVILTKP